MFAVDAMAQAHSLGHFTRGECSYSKWKGDFIRYPLLVYSIAIAERSESIHPTNEIAHTRTTRPKKPLNSSFEQVFTVHSRRVAIRHLLKVLLYRKIFEERS